ncbi:MAG: hypothetical protein MI684_04230, partial [Chlorobiales bacterium]|nr:hypothetical protein [Chlorobiales bacterium]
AERPLSLNDAVTFSHEIVHALQNQWQLEQRDRDYHRIRFAPIFENVDSLLAYRMILEGDAVGSTLNTEAIINTLGLDVHWGEPQSGALELAGVSPTDAAPLNSALFYAPYELGAEMVAAIVSAQGRDAVNALLLDPPDSTEQALHLDKLEADEQSIGLDDPPALPALDDWELDEAKRLGELTLRLLIELATGQPELAVEAAAGWGGDRLSLYHPADGSDDTLLLWQIVFDNSAEHREGATGLREWLIAHAGGTDQLGGDARSLVWQGDQAVVHLLDNGEAIWLIITTDAELGAEIAEQLQMA